MIISMYNDNDITMQKTVQRKSSSQKVVLKYNNDNLWKQEDEIQNFNIKCLKFSFDEAAWNNTNHFLVDKLHLIDGEITQ